MTPREKLSSPGISGLDTIFNGGLPSDRTYLVCGPGKTTFDLQFLLEGSRHGGKAPHIVTSETRFEIESIAHSHGWDISGVTVHQNDRTQLAESPMELSPGRISLGGSMDRLMGMSDGFQKPQSYPTKKERENS
ncbi:MAG: ATPase domain-containing protein [Thermoplasmatota archaeon]